MTKFDEFCMYVFFVNIIIGVVAIGYFSYQIVGWYCLLLVSLYFAIVVLGVQRYNETK